jgi:hypothetical protein
MRRFLLCGLIATLSIAVAPPRSGAAPAKVRMLWELNGTADLACLATADLTGKGETEVLACDQTGTLHVIGLNGKEKRTLSGTCWLPMEGAER